MIEKLVIFFCCYVGNATEPEGVIVIYPDSVRAFSTTWAITEMSTLNTYGEKVHTGVLYLKSDETKAFLEINGDRVRFAIPGIENAHMRQKLHTEELYEKYGLY